MLEDHPIRGHGQWHCQTQQGASISPGPLLRVSMWLLFLVSYFLIALFAHQVSVEHRESDKECNTDQILNGFDVLVEIYHGVHRLNMADGIEYI